MQYTNIVEDSAVTSDTSLITEHGLGCITSTDGTFILYANTTGIYKRILSTGVTTLQLSWSTYSISPTNNVFFCKNSSGIYCVHAAHGSYVIHLFTLTTDGSYSAYSSCTTSPGFNGQFYVDIWVSSSSTIPYLMYSIPGSVGCVNTSTATLYQNVEPSNYSLRCPNSSAPHFISWNGSVTKLLRFDPSFATWSSSTLSTYNLISSITETQSGTWRGYVKSYTTGLFSGIAFVLAPFLEDSTYKLRFVTTRTMYEPNGDEVIYTISDSIIILPALQNMDEWGYAYDESTKENMYLVHYKSWCLYLVKTFSATTYNTICPSNFGIIRASSTAFVIDREEMTDISCEGTISNTFTLQSSDRLSNFTYRFYNDTDELISVARVNSSSYSNGIFTHNCVDLRLANFNNTYTNALQKQLISNLLLFTSFINNFPGNYCEETYSSWGYDPGDFEQNQYKTITQSQFEEIVENILSVYAVHHPDGLIEINPNGVDSGITLSYANENFYSSSFTESEKNEKPRMIIGYGSTPSVKVTRLSNYESGVVMRITFPLINDTTTLRNLIDDIIANLVNVYTVTMKTTMLIQEGMYCTLNVSDKSDLHPILGAFNGTMYVSYASYDVSEECTNVTLQSAMTFKSKVGNTERLFQISDGLSSKFLQGSIYLPYFQANNYNTATSAWVSQACADNTVTPLNLYNIVKNEGGWTWSSSERTKVYVPTSGWYLFQARVQFAGNTSGTRQARLRIDGTNADTHMVSQFITQGSGDTIVNATGMGWVDEGSYVECCGLQDTSPGVSLNMKYMAFNIVRLSL